MDHQDKEKRPMGSSQHGGGRIWLTRDVVRAAERVAYGSWPSGTLHTVDLHVPSRPLSKPKRTGQRSAHSSRLQETKAKTIHRTSPRMAPGKGSARAAVPSEWQQRVVEAQTNRNHDSRTLVESPAKSVKTPAHDIETTPEEDVETAQCEKFTEPVQMANDTKGSSKDKAGNYASSVINARINRLESDTKATEKKYNAIEDIQRLRKQKLKEVRKGQHSTNLDIDPGKVRHKLTMVARSSNNDSAGTKAQPEKRRLDRSRRKRNKVERRREKDPANEPVEEQGWRHKLTSVFQEGLRELDTFFNSRGRTLDRAHRKEVAALLSQYHSFMLETLDKLREIRAENRKERGHVNRVLERREGLRKKMENIEEKCRELEFEISRIQSRLKRREDSARSYSHTQAKETSHHRAHVNVIKQQLDALTCDHSILESRKEELENEIHSLKLTFKQQQIRLFEAKKHQRHMLGIHWKTESDGKDRNTQELNSVAHQKSAKASPASTLPASARARIIPKNNNAEKAKPTISASITDALERLSLKAKMLDTIRNCLVCMSCFNLAKRCMVDWKSGELLCSNCCAKQGLLSLDEGNDTIKRVLENPKFRALELTFTKHGMFDNVQVHHKKRNGSQSRSRTSKNSSNPRHLNNKKVGPVEIVKKLKRIVNNGFTDLVRPPTPPPPGSLVLDTKNPDVNKNTQRQSLSRASQDSIPGWRTPIEPW